MASGISQKHFNSYTPALEELVDVLGNGLKKYFAEVQVSLLDSPDFTQKPFSSAIKGLNGKPRIADVGGVHNLIPRVNLESKFSLNEVCKSTHSQDEFPVSIFGPGAGPFEQLGFNSELMASAKCNGVDHINCLCRFAYVDEQGNSQFRELDGPKFGLMGNFFICQDLPGKVLKIVVKKRIDKLNYTDSIRAVLLEKYGDKPVSMGGIFLINSGTANLHVMPKCWPEEPSTNDTVNNHWLKYYLFDKNPPLVCLSVFHSYDPGYDLRMEHTHCYNPNTETDAGHYHYDTTPDIVEYEGYFNVAEQVHRLGGPNDDEAKNTF